MFLVQTFPVSKGKKQLSRCAFSRTTLRINDGVRVDHILVNAWQLLMQRRRFLSAVWSSKRNVCLVMGFTGHPFVVPVADGMRGSACYPYC